MGILSHQPLAGWLLRATWQASVLIIMVLLVQRLLRGWLNPRYRYGLWLLVVIRLAVPFSLESRWSVFNVFSSGGSGLPGVAAVTSAVGGLAPNWAGSPALPVT